MVQEMDIKPKAKCDYCTCRKVKFSDFSMSFQPIWDLKRQQVFGYEALVRGVTNESAYSVLSQVNAENKYSFDQQCRSKAIQLAAELGLDSVLSINFLPNAVYEPERCLATTLRLAKKYNFPTSKIMFEFTEGERIKDTQHLKNIVEYYQKLGFLTAIDDFGAGHSGLSLLADLQPNVAKLDMGLIRDINSSVSRQIIVKNCVSMFQQLGVSVLAEGVETLEEMTFLQSLDIDLVQGYLIASPGFECLPPPNFRLLI
ncbi:EAL domain-containing protein [Vibrio parahaemolyticus]|nr:EAL domain-containing protein [Vibrio alginolyticus]MBE3722380.1 EAL domain-containing protein [Vibrio parahaemolyticus]OED86097.1 diguanylate phosphodiesterase [Vibrio cyclitrophicus ZF30]OEE16302.1 diguanylate phosphodiesterase [Vibrio cyclitrophicus ZF207]PMJ28446.1 diguanylate phosphodiesterase [Vibrio cyclitrophicus]